MPQRDASAEDSIRSKAKEMSDPTALMRAETEAMLTVFTALEPLPAENRLSVLKWAADKLGVLELFDQVREHDTKIRAQAGGDGKASDEGAAADTGGLPKRAAAWIKKHALTQEELEAAFHVKDGAAEITAGIIPGKSKREQTINSYIITGASSLLATGEAKFLDATAREVCNVYGCLDPGNHSKYLGDKGNAISGSKEKGWELTNPGLDKAAALVKEIAKAA